MESDFQRKGARSCLPNSESLQAHAAAATQRVHVKPCQSWAEELPHSSLFLPFVLLFTPPLYSSPESRNTALGPLSHSVTPCIKFPCIQRGVSKQDDGHYLLLLMTTLPRSWGEEASQRKSPSAKKPLQKGHSLAPYYLHSYTAPSLDSGEAFHMLRNKKDHAIWRSTCMFAHCACSGAPLDNIPVCSHR